LLPKTPKPHHQTNKIKFLQQYHQTSSSSSTGLQYFFRVSIVLL